MKPRIIINSRINLTNIPLNVAKKAVALAVLSCALASTQAQVLFFDDFNGPTLDPAWQTGLSSMQVGAFYGPATYIGAPTYSSLEAALRPTPSEFLYYLHDAQKQLHPSRDAAEHEAMRKKYDVY